MAKVLSIIAAEGYQDQEYEDSKKALEKRGHTVITASTVPEAHGKFDSTTKTDILLNEVKTEEYDAVAFIGGPGCSQYFNHPIAHNIAKSFYEAGKPTCAICAAPSILANAGLLKDKEATCYESEAQNLTNKGSIFTGKAVTIDGNIITANGPKAAKKFGKKIAKALS